MNRVLLLFVKGSYRIQIQVSESLKPILMCFDNPNLIDSAVFTDIYVKGFVKKGRDFNISRYWNMNGVTICSLPCKQEIQESIPSSR